MKKILKFLAVLVILAVVIIAGAMVFLTQGLKEGANVEISGLNLADVADGTYTGKYEGGRWSNELKVLVEDNKIKDIEIAKDVMVPQEGLSGKVFAEVVERQDTDIDVVSGATVTTKAYLKSIENALSK
ncbi:MAG: FMN-binding protein [Clostridiaceae bacterium]